MWQVVSNLLYEAVDQCAGLNVAGTWSSRLKELAVFVEKHETGNALYVVARESGTVLDVGHDVLLPLWIVLLQFIQPKIAFCIDGNGDDAHLSARILF